MAEVSLTGGCQCGAVRYRLRSPEWTTVCHCRMCQKASGQPFMAFAGGAADKLTWTNGEPQFFRSSEIAERGFCSACGTPLSYGRIGSGRLSVTLQSLDDASGLEPTRQVGIESKVTWLDGLSDVPGIRADEWLRSQGHASAGSHQHPDREKV